MSLTHGARLHCLLTSGHSLAQATNQFCRIQGISPSFREDVIGQALREDVISRLCRSAIWSQQLSYFELVNPPNGIEQALRRGATYPGNRLGHLRHLPGEECRLFNVRPSTSPCTRCLSNKSVGSGAQWSHRVPEAPEKTSMPGG